MTNPAIGRSSILAVIVLYHRTPEASPAWTGLQQAVARISPRLQSFRVILYDNSPGASVPALLPAWATYRADSSNGGLSPAYNYALNIAEAEGYDWLLTLDQDTDLPGDFLDRISEYAIEVSGRGEIAVIVPQLREGEILLSPRIVLTGRTRAVPPRFVGVRREEVHAFNSAALWRVSAVRQIGGYSNCFRLDHLDIWMHHQLHRAGFRTYVAGDIQLQHCLSLLDYKKRIGAERYRDFLVAESAFCDLCKGPLERALLTARLFARLLRQKARGERVEILHLTLRAALDRMTVFKARRIARWSASVRAKVSGLRAGEPQKQCVSVCIASYNGVRFIEQQLRSILEQLDESDEVVIVDDGSTDGTVSIVRGLKDPRILLVRAGENRGVVRTFEEAIRRARGDLIFLADQDDLWASDKVAVTLNAFAENPEADLIVSDASLIDEDGNRIGESYYVVRGAFRSGLLENIIRCKYLGCTMAFRRCLRDVALPFPVGTNVLHDIWIGSVNALTGGTTVFVDRPLVHYRRHAKNVTGNHLLSRSRQLQIRWELCAALAELWWCRWRGKSR
jgi:GT2 family glycosyltransferase